MTFYPLSLFLPCLHDPTAQQIGFSLSAESFMYLPKLCCLFFSQKYFALFYLFTPVLLSSSVHLSPVHICYSKAAFESFLQPDMKICKVQYRVFFQLVNYLTMINCKILHNLFLLTHGISANGERENLLFSCKRKNVQPQHNIQEVFID